MIERLKESSGGVIGFKVTGKMTAEDIKGFEQQIGFLLAERKHKPIGILADLSEMHGAELAARWDEMRFLQKHTDHIARMAVVGAGKWEEIMAILTAGAAVLAVRDALLRRVRNPERLGVGAHRQTRRRRPRPPDSAAHRHLEGLPPGVYGPIDRGLPAMRSQSCWVLLRQIARDGEVIREASSCCGSGVPGSDDLTVALQNKRANE